MSNHRFCCCGNPGCTSNFRVFMPCADTYDTVEVLPVVLTVAQFTASGLSENVVYLYDASANDCDDFCGQWICTLDADAEDALCYADSNDCPACEEWSGTTPPTPWRAIRPSEETAFYARFTEMDDGGCCDQRCPFVDCGFGQIITGDCFDCYDPALLGWAVDLNYTQSAQASCNIRTAQAQDNGGADCALDGALRTIDCDVSIYDVRPTITGTSLKLEVELQYLFTKNMTDDCNAYDPNDPAWQCEPTCINGDPADQDVIGTQWVKYDTISVTIPCMGTVSLSTSGTETGTDDTNCGLFNLPGVSFGTLTQNAISAIGWGGNAEIYTLTRDITWSPSINSCAVCDTNSVSGAGQIEFRLSASLPDRPEDCT